MNKTKKQIKLWEALLPALVLISILAFNVYVFGDSATSGSNQFVLIIGAAVAMAIGLKNKFKVSEMLENVYDNIKSTSGAILILLFVGSLSGTWLISGIIPTMIYYGLKILQPSIFFPATLIITAIVSVATGSSWTTSATVGIALIAIGQSLGFDSGMVAGAVISGAYFGDKMSPMSDTTNLAPAMAGTDLFTHIRYMTITTVPTFLITLIIFIFIGLFSTSTGEVDTEKTLKSITDIFNVSPFLFLVPALVIFMIIKKTNPLIALFTGAVLGGVFALIFQPSIVAKVGGGTQMDFVTGYKGVLNALTIQTSIETDNSQLTDLFRAKGMAGMLSTIWLIICAMIFGGVMEAIGALSKITEVLLSFATSVFGLFASTVASCLALNLTASDQYLAIVVPGKMFAEAYKQKNLAPENLSRTLEDTGTVTSVLVPWNTCGAYQSQVLGVDTLAYLPYAFFNIISPFMTLLFAALNIKIKKIVEDIA
ncbi:Na+/H+ antiporter NhaC [Lacihabitans sp. LS3-19]|uniref:Na+/H+ antiporter NhaC n=1 Tax=Lacihabitans sp. LS3-19 TaxID=2487335 RepID=UPI0020CD34C1|nr:Na+/H+ antiporter NhaC [Lacihabitans sp. LS3-19]MCP9767804.1 Na+/H+ antiporter NhaC [Lacihabitans sp. LS3-19]